MTAKDNAAIVVAFYNRLFNDKQVQEAVDSAVGATYIQHNPATPDGREALIEFAGDWAQRYPDLRLDVVRVLADGDLVMTHGRLTFVPGGPETALADIWRLDEDGRIVEHWDVIQQVPETAVNANTMF